MNNSFLDRSMDSVNFSSNEFMEPHISSNYQNKIKKDFLSKKGNNHLDRIFDQTAINPHFTGMSEKKMNLSSRPMSSFDIEKQTVFKKPNQDNYKQHVMNHQNKVKETSCQYCDSYRKKNMKYEEMLYKLQKEVSMKDTELVKYKNELQNRDKSRNEIRIEYSKLQEQIKHKNIECEVLEKKISSLQLEQREKNKSLIEEEIKKVNQKYYEMMKHYEKVIGELRKEIIELTQSQQENKEIESPMKQQLIQILCKKLEKSEEDIKEKLKDYEIPEKLTVEELNKILKLYK